MKKKKGQLIKSNGDISEIFISSTNDLEKVLDCTTVGYYSTNDFILVHDDEYLKTDKPYNEKASQLFEMEVRGNVIVYSKVWDEESFGYCCNSLERSVLDCYLQI